MWSLHISGSRERDADRLGPGRKLDQKHGIRIRKMSRLHLRRDLDAFAEIYNEAWSRNFGFVPYTKEDVDAYAQELQLVYDRDWFMIAEDSEEDSRHGDHGAGRSARC